MTQHTQKPLASISLDLDDQWTYMKTHGDPGWEKYPSYLSYAVPRILDFLEEKKVKITFFIVAQDAAFDHNREVLGEIQHRGHDIGNHTFHHDPWLHVYSEAEVNDELARAEDHIEKVTGVRPRGFRGPGFSFSDTVLDVLAKRDYVYDASTFPNILNPLARMYFLWTSSLDKEERERRKGLFGSWKDGFRPNKPFKWQANGKSILEIPVTTMPFFKVPIHASYILFLGTYSPWLAITYFKTVIRMCLISGVQPSILLHPLDFIGCDDTEELSFFPAMRTESKEKIEIMSRVFDLMNKHFQPVTMMEHARSLQDNERLPVKSLSLA